MKELTFVLVALLAFIILLGEPAEGAITGSFIFFKVAAATYLIILFSILNRAKK